MLLIMCFFWFFVYTEFGGFCQIIDFIEYSFLLICCLCIYNSVLCFAAMEAAHNYAHSKNNPDEDSGKT